MLRTDGTEVCRRRCTPTVGSFSELEAAALDSASEGTRLEIVVEPTGQAWLPVAVFFGRRGHTVYRVPSAKAADLRWFLSRHASPTRSMRGGSPGWPWSILRGSAPSSSRADPASLDRRVRAADRLTRAGAEHKRRLKDLVRMLMPASPLTGDIGRSDLAVLERYADPNALLRAGKARLIALIARASNNHLGADRAQQWLAAARAAVALYAGDAAVAFADLAAEVAMEVRLLRATEAELAHHAEAREQAYQKVDPDFLARSLPGIAEVGGPVLQAAVGGRTGSRTPRSSRASPGSPRRRRRPGRPTARASRCPRRDPRSLRGQLLRSADVARTIDPQLAAIYFAQMVERGANHLKACCVVAAHLAERAGAVLARGTPYELHDTDGRVVSREEAKATIAERWTVPEDVRRRRRSKKVGKVPHQVLVGHVSRARSAIPRRPSPQPIVDVASRTVKSARGGA